LVYPTNRKINKKMKTFAEKQFDELFAEKPVVNYEFSSENMGRRDRRIAECLLEYGIKEKKCLDVGPGTGRWLQFIKNHEADYIGAIDVSEESLKRCTSICDKTQKANVETDKFDFESDFFDIVISFEVLEHLRNPDNYLSEILRITKTGAIIIIAVPNLVSLISRLRVLFGFLPAAVAADETHVRFYRQKDITRLLNTYELRPIFIPTSISLNPLKPKSKFSLPSIKLLSSLDDSLLFMIRNDMKQY
jgi:2-polyprenyl-3-methyl-5-hydroxy-6-metoxy-1,4-benzoquinol methylase